MKSGTGNGLLAGYDVAELRVKLAREPFAAAFADMRERVRETAACDRESDVIRAGGWCHSLYFTPLVLEAGFVHALTGDPEAAAHVARQIDKLVRVYADPPDSFRREIAGLPPRSKLTAYFSNAHTCLAARMCGPAGLGEAAYARIRDLARARLIDDHHTPYFFTHFNAGHNAVVTHMIAGAICALVFGGESGHPETDRVIELGRDACEMHAQWGFDEAGVPFEGPMYALVTLQWVFLFADLLRRAGRENLFETLPKLAVLAQAQAEMQLPGTRGYFGAQDCRRLIVREPMSWLLLTAREYGRPQDLALWAETQAEPDTLQPHQALRTGALGVLEMLWWDGSRPACPLAQAGLPTALFGRGAATVVLRSSWIADAICVQAHGQGRSHNVPDHTHADAGHFSIFAYGEYLAYDSAYFNFDEDTHSVVLIDGKPHCPTRQGNLFHGRFTRAFRHALLDGVTVDAAAAKGCMWAERHLLFVRGEGEFAYLVTLDNINRDNGVHAFTWQLQARPGCRIETAGDTGRVLGERARLECHFISPLPEDFPGCAHVLKVYANEQPHRDPLTGEPAAHPRLAAEQTGPNCTLMALVIPRRPADPPVRVRSAPGSRTFNVYVEHGRYIDQIVFACDHSWVRLPDLRASAEAVVVRRDRAGAVLDCWTLDGRPANPAAFP